MASRYFTEMREKKLKGGAKYQPPGTGSRGSVKEKTPKWPGLPGKGGPDRSAGVSRKGSMGPFNVKKEGFSG